MPQSTPRVRDSIADRAAATPSRSPLSVQAWQVRERPRQTHQAAPDSEHSTPAAALMAVTRSHVKAQHIRAPTSRQDQAPPFRCACHVFHVHHDSSPMSADVTHAKIQPVVTLNEPPATSGFFFARRSLPRSCNWFPKEGKLPIETCGLDRA